MLTNIECDFLKIEIKSKIDKWFCGTNIDIKCKQKIMPSDDKLFIAKKLENLKRKYEKIETKENFGHR